VSTRTVFSLAALADSLGLEYRGNPDTPISGLASLESASATHLTFYNNPRFLNDLQNTRAAAVILKQEHASLTGVAVLVTPDPYIAFARASQLFARQPRRIVGIHPSALIDPAARVDATASIGPHVIIGAETVIEAQVCIAANCVIGEDCFIGEGSVINPNVTLYDDVHIGKFAIVHSGVVLGGDGFGFANDGRQYQKIYQLGGVRIGDRVEIGACTSIDCGALDHTEIADGVKIDNQVQIAHNVKIGANTVICGCSAIAGSSRIGKNCIIAGAAGVINHIEICDGVTVTAMSLVNQSISVPGVYSSGTGLLESGLWKKAIVRIKQLDTIWKRLLQLERTLESKTLQKPENSPEKLTTKLDHEVSTGKD